MKITYPKINSRIYSKKHDWTVLLFSTLLFFVSGIIRSIGNTYSFEEVLIGVDDWNRYARFGVDILENGLEIPSLPSVYIYPAGFLYNYFLAFCFLLVGKNLLAVYLIQSALLGASLAIGYFIFRRYFNANRAYLLLSFLIIFGFLDVFKNYSFRLISENLVIFTLAILFYFLQKWFDFKRFKDMLLFVLFGVFSLFIRPNTFPFFLVFLPVIAYYCYNSTRLRIQYLVSFSLAILLFFMLFLRNYVAVGETQFLPVDGAFVDYIFIYNPINIDTDPISFFMYYPKKILFTLGYLSILDNAFSIRPHWLLMYLGVALFLFYYLKKRISINPFQLIVLIFSLVFIGTLLVFGLIHSYGFRFLMPIIFWILPFSLLGFYTLFDAWKEKRELKSSDF